MEYQFFGLGPLYSVISNPIIVSPDYLRLECVYDPAHTAVPYAVVFHQCMSVEWSRLDEEATADDSAELIGVSLGFKDGAAATIITTNVWELKVIATSYTVIPYPDGGV